MTKKLILLSLASLAQISSAFSESPPVTLNCISNASASRAYNYPIGTVDPRQGWQMRSTDKFTIVEAPSSKWAALRNKRFEFLNTGEVRVTSITPANEGTKEQTAVFVGRVVGDLGGRFVLVEWSNPPGNKLWTAVIDREGKKAIVSEVNAGVTAIAGKIETLDCE